MTSQNLVAQSIARVDRGSKLGSLLNPEGRSWLRANYPVALIIADRLSIFKVHGDTIVFADSEAMEESVNENQYDSIDQVYEDLDCYIGPLQYLYTITQDDVILSSQSELEGSNISNELEVVHSLSIGGDAWNDTSFLFDDNSLHPMIVRMYVITLIGITENVTLMSRPGSSAIVDESFDRHEKSLATKGPVSEEDWDF